MTAPKISGAVARQLVNIDRETDPVRIRNRASRALNAAIRLHEAQDRQGRAETVEDWLADQAAIDRALAEIAS